MNELTVVTGLWNIDRGALSNEAFRRPFKHYLDNFEKLLKADVPMYIYTESSMVDFIWQRRKKENTKIQIREIEEFKTWFGFFESVDNIRTDERWYNQGWLTDSPQAKLKYYNPIVMSKMFMLNDAVLNNPFKSTHMIWLDSAITNTVNESYFVNEHNIFKRMIPNMDKFLFLSFPYEESSEIHGFERRAANSMAQVDNIKYVCRGGLFGGKLDDIKQQNGIYYGMLADSLKNKLMGTEESIFSIMAHRYPEYYNRFMLKAHGMIANYCEAVMDDEVRFEPPPSSKLKEQTLLTFKSISSVSEKIEKPTSLYVLTFNFPQQLEMTIHHWSHSPELITKTRKFCVDNSTDSSAIIKNKELCQQYDIEYLPMPSNIGICGGRQYVAEHFDEDPKSKYYIFFEDDMLICSKNMSECSFGFIRWTPDLLGKMIHIVEYHQLDYLKMSFSEFFGNHSKQWAWHNVPQIKREEYWPEMPEVKEGLDGPRVKYEHIYTHQGLPYATGEVYYSNWPMLMTKNGNRKVFLLTTWAHPYEQTWSSFVCSQIREGKIKSGVLLASVINHNRIHHYAADDRREN